MTVTDQELINATREAYAAYDKADARLASAEEGAAMARLARDTAREEWHRLKEACRKKGLNWR